MGEAPKFRLMSQIGGQETLHDEAWRGVVTLIDPRFVVPMEQWMAQVKEAGVAGARIQAMAEVPLIAALARIRSNGDAALALTGVLELISRRFQISIPVGTDGGAQFRFLAPAEAQFHLITEAIDDSLRSIMRATDLQGALREQAQSRIEALPQGG